MYHNYISGISIYCSQNIYNKLVIFLLEKMRAAAPMKISV